jgi:xylan 1,4-beta-xylosidase
MRDQLLQLCLLMVLAIACRSQQPSNTTSGRLECIEGQRCPDLGNDQYLNPILGGDYPDPSVLRIGKDYYMTHSCFEYVPGLLIWHSTDLVNWQPVCNALNEYIGSIFAPDLIQHDSLFYIYFPVVKYEGDQMAGISNAVVTAPSPEGPWSSVVDLEVGYIDPGHVVDDEGKRYLHLSEGHMVELARNGLSVKGKPGKVYEGWEYPDSFCVEGFCLEAPKLTSAEGGTAGPATSHMVVSSRSETPWGSWEHSPFNPVVERTRHPGIHTG